MHRQTPTKKRELALELATLRSLYDINSELRIKRNQLRYHLSIFFLNVTFFYLIHPAMKAFYLKMTYDVFIEKFNFTDNVQEQRRLLINIAKFLAEIIGEENARQLCHDLNFTKLVNSHLIKVVHSYWSTCFDQYFIPRSLSLGMLQHFISLDSVDRFIRASRYVGGMFFTSTGLLLAYSVVENDKKNRFNIEVHENLTKDEIKKLNLKITKENLALRAASDRNNQILKSLLALFVIPTLIYMYLKDALSMDLFLVQLFCLLPLIDQVAHEIWRNYQRNKLASNLSNIDRELKKYIPSEILSQIVTVEGETIASSYINISFSKVNKLPDKIVCRLAKAVFLSHGFPIINFHGNSFSVIAKFPSELLGQKLKTDLDNAMNQYQNSRLLTHQLEALSDFLRVGGILIPQSKKGLPSLKFIICTSHQDYFNDAIINKIKTLFAKNTIVTTEEHIIITGHQPCDPNELQAFYQAVAPLLPVHQLPPSSGINANDNNTNDNNDHDYNEFNSKNKNANKEKKSSDNPSTDIKPKINKPSLRDIKLINGYGLPACFFSKFTLKREDFGLFAGTREKKGSYDKFIALAKDPRLAPSREGAQGFVFIDKFKKDKQGKIFHATGMFKILGKKGDQRVYCSEETIDGKLVYVSRVFKPKTHKKQNT